MSKRLLIQVKCSGGRGGGVVGSENSLEQQEITRKHRGNQGLLQPQQKRLKLDE